MDQSIKPPEAECFRNSRWLDLIKEEIDINNIMKFVHHLFKLKSLSMESIGEIISILELSR